MEVIGLWGKKKQTNPTLIKTQKANKQTSMTS